MQKNGTEMFKKIAAVAKLFFLLIRPMALAKTMYSNLVGENIEGRRSIGEGSM